MSAPPQTLAEAKAAQLKTTIDEAIERLAQQLAEGHTAEYRQLLTFWSHFHRYSHGNVLLILSQRPDATQVAGYHRWKRAGRQVKQGSRAISIWCPILRTIEDEQTHLPVEQCVGFVPCPVFAAEDLVDIATTPLPTLWQPLPDDVDGLYRYVKRKVEEAGYAASEKPLPPGRQGMVAPDGTITLASGLDSRNRIMVLCHELAHALEHFRPEREGAPRDQKELEAESAAMVVCSMLGLAHPTARDYILSFHGDGEGLKASLGAIHRIVGRMATLLGLLRRPQDAALAPLAAD